MAETFDATVVITTKNRKDDLRTALASCLEQTANIEILVIDDGSDDGTSEMVRNEFPTVHLDRQETSLGLIAERNRGADLASAPIVVSIDDDAAFPSPRTIEQTLAEFDHPRVGAVAIPFINVRQDEHAVHQRAADDGERYVVHKYIGTAHALRRDLFRQLTGYRPWFIHQGEEGDYCVRMLAAGYVVRLGRADPIHHFESPRRDFRRMDYYGRRNDVLSAWCNVPLPSLLWQLPGTTVKGALFGLKLGRPFRMLYGLAGGYASICRHFGERSPVSTNAYRLSQSLKRNGPMPLSEIESDLPPMTPVNA